MSGDAALTASTRKLPPTFQPAVGETSEALIAGVYTATAFVSEYPDRSPPRRMTRLFWFWGRHFWTSSWLFAASMHLICPGVMKSFAGGFSVMWTVMKSFSL